MGPFTHVKYSITLSLKGSLMHACAHTHFADAELDIQASLRCTLVFIESTKHLYLVFTNTQGVHLLCVQHKAVSGQAWSETSWWESAPGVRLVLPPLLFLLSSILPSLPSHSGPLSQTSNSSQTKSPLNRNSPLGSNGTRLSLLLSIVLYCNFFLHLSPLPLLSPEWTRSS